MYCTAHLQSKKHASQFIFFFFFILISFLSLHLCYWKLNLECPWNMKGSTQQSIVSQLLVQFHSGFYLVGHQTAEPFSDTMQPCDPKTVHWKKSFHLTQPPPALVFFLPLFCSNRWNKHDLCNNLFVSPVLPPEISLSLDRRRLSKWVCVSWGKWHTHNTFYLFWGKKNIWFLRLTIRFSLFCSNFPENLFPSSAFMQLHTP